MNVFGRRLISVPTLLALALAGCAPAQSTGGGVTYTVAQAPAPAGTEAGGEPAAAPGAATPGSAIAIANFQPGLRTEGGAVTLDLMLDAPLRLRVEDADPVGWVAVEHGGGFREWPRPQSALELRTNTARRGVGFEAPVAARPNTTRLLLSVLSEFAFSENAESIRVGIRNSDAHLVATGADLEALRAFSNAARQARGLALDPNPANLPRLVEYFSGGYWYVDATVASGSQLPADGLIIRQRFGTGEYSRVEFEISNPRAGLVQGACALDVAIDGRSAGRFELIHPVPSFYGYFAPETLTRDMGAARRVRLDSCFGRVNLTDADRRAVASLPDRLAQISSAPPL